MHMMVHYYCINDLATTRYMITTVSVIAQRLDVAATSVRIQPQLMIERKIEQQGGKVK